MRLPTKPFYPPLAALGMAVVLHLGGAALWQSCQGVHTGKSAPATAASSRALPWQVRQVWAPAATPAAKVVDTTQRWAKAADQARPATEPAALVGTGMADHADVGEPPAHFWPSADLDFRAWPKQAPDTTPLTGLAWTATRPIRLRLSITAQGQVVDVAPLGDAPLPPEALDALTAMFKATPFMPARRQGKDVASWQDIEVAP